MGGTQAREEELQDDVFPWFHLIQWSAEDASNNRIFHYDLAGAQEAARALTRDTDSFLRLCPSSLPPNSGFTMDDSTNFAEWAGALLEWNSELRRVRFELVPRRLTENGFWSRYFAALRREIQQLIFHDEDTEEGQHPLANGDGSESGG
ncbi:unnamed protein product [Durusdinium trenchii]|uniref:BSD domain-containing protein n=2 Tax=Durusdinium trenchii TaxID=1381693 RepID=A0ABP0KIH1_9DINO